MVADAKYTFQILGSDRTKAAFASLHKSIRSTVNAAGALGAGVAAGLAVMVTQSIRANTEMSRLAQSVGVGTETLSEWSHAAGTVEVAGDKVADIFKDVSDKIGDLATTGGGPAAAVFDRLNLSASQLVALKPDQQLLAIAGALDQVKSRSERVFLLESLASDASNLLPILEDGAEGLRELAEEAEALGVSITDIDAAKLEAANRSFERIQSVATGLANKVAVEVAPVIEVLAEKFVATAIEGDRLGKAVSKGFELGTKGAATLANGVHGVRVVVKGLEVLARGAFAVMTEGVSRLATLIGDDVRNAIIGGFFTPLKSTLRLLSKVSGAFGEMLADVQAVEDRLKESGTAAFENLASRHAEKFREAQDEFATLLAAELPGQVITRSLDAITAEAERRAEASVAKLAARVQAPPEQTVAEDAAGQEAAQREREKLQARLARLDGQYLTETQKLRQKLADEILIIGEAEQAKLITEQDAANRRLRALEAFNKSKIDLEKKSSKTVQSVLQSTASFAQAFQAAGSEKLFRVQRAAALAQAAVELPPAIIASYKNAGGFPLGIPAAAAMAAAGAAQIAAIKAQSIGSGGGSAPLAAGAGSGPIPTPSALPAGNLQRVTAGFERNEEQRPPTIVQFNVSGDIIGDAAENLLDRMRTLIEDNDAVLFTAGSRQALEIAGG